MEKISFLEIFDDEDFKILEKYIQIKEFSEGDIIVKEGERRGEGIFIIVSGSVDIVKNFNGREVVLATLRKGDFFGESDLFSNSVRNATCISKDKKTILMNIKKEGIEEIEKKHPHCAIKLYKVISQILSSRLRKMDEEYTKLFFETKGLEKSSELKELKEKLIKEWKI